MSRGTRRRSRRTRLGQRPAAGILVVVLLSACGGGEEPDPASSAESEDPLAVEAAVGDSEAADGGHDADGPLLLPASVGFEGDLSGTYSDVPTCQTGGDGTELRILFGGTDKSFVWLGDPPDETGGALSASILVEGFAGGGNYDGDLFLGRVDEIASGSVSLEVEELRREKFPTGEVLVLTGTVGGTYSGMAGSGSFQGDIGVCNVRMP